MHTHTHTLTHARTHSHPPTPPNNHQLKCQKAIKNQQQQKHVKHLHVTKVNEWVVSGLQCYATLVTLGSDSTPTTASMGQTGTHNADWDYYSVIMITLGSLPVPTLSMLLMRACFVVVDVLFDSDEVIYTACL